MKRFWPEWANSVTGSASVPLETVAFIDSFGPSLMPQSSMPKTQVERELITEYEQQVLAENPDIAALFDRDRWLADEFVDLDTASVACTSSAATKRAVCICGRASPVSIGRYRRM